MANLTDAEMEAGAAETVRELLAALAAGDAHAYHALLCEADRTVMSEEALQGSFQALRDDGERLVSGRVEGVVLHRAAAHAAVQVSLEFARGGPKTELYNVILEDGAWRLDFDFDELL
jgi:hypothetical protein